MRQWLAVVAASLVGILAALTGFAPPAFVIPATVIALWSLFYWLKAYRRHRRSTPGGKAKWVIVDGSNVMYWKNGEPRIDSIRGVLDKLTKMGFTSGVIFDANAGYLLTGKYENHTQMSKLLELPEDRVMVSPSGEQADGMILTVAKDLGAKVVTNDQFRDWRDHHPEIGAPGYLIKGAYQNGKVKLYSDRRPDAPSTRVTAEP